MGYIKKEWILVSCHEIPDKIKRWINNLPKNEKAFFYCNDSKTNGYGTIFMDWDGSKEGWDTSNRFNEVRKNFIKRVKKECRFARILYICDDEYKDRPYMRRGKTWRG